MRRSIALVTMLFLTASAAVLPFSARALAAAPKHGGTLVYAA